MDGMLQHRLNIPQLTRRKFVSGIGLASAAYLFGLNASHANSPGIGTNTNGPMTIGGNKFNLDIGYRDVNFTGRAKIATVINGSLPGPVLRWKEGDRVTIRVKNNLAHDTSIHWHGMILPTGMDGVPGLSFDGIKPGEQFTYEFDLKQSGTYWYHSHSGFQEQTGVYGAIVIDPRDSDPITYDRDYVVLLSDWSDEQPEAIYAKLKKLSHYYNFQERTAGDLWQDIKRKGVKSTFSERAMWNQMRMSDSDLADVTGYTYTYLMNGFTPAAGWKALFKAGEKVRLRFINASAMTLFDVRIPGLKLKVVAADGQNVEPFSIDEFRIGVAETYDVIVEPNGNEAYTIFAQTMDRSGYTRGTLTPDYALDAPIPAMDHKPVLGHRDMGMAHLHQENTSQSMNMAEHGGMPQSNHANHSMSHCSPEHAAMGHCEMREPESKEGKAGYGSASRIIHQQTEFGPHVDMLAEAPPSGLHDPGVGLRDHNQRYGRKVLTYADIRNLSPTRDRREPERELQLHLTGNMSRYMWSINGVKYDDADPIHLNYGERLRITLVNDTMMTHPMHLHGMWSELETGDPNFLPRKHTILVQPGSSISYLLTADALGRWAFHCHLLFHMAGMFREVRVTEGSKK